MNNWMNRLAILAVVGAILSSALMVGCGNSADDDTTAANTANVVAPAAGDETP